MSAEQDSRDQTRREAIEAGFPPEIADLIAAGVSAEASRSALATAVRRLPEMQALCTVRGATVGLAYSMAAEGLDIRGAAVLLAGVVNEEEVVTAAGEETIRFQLMQRRVKAGAK